MRTTQLYPKLLVLLIVVVLTLLMTPLVSADCWGTINTSANVSNVTLIAPDNLTLSGDLAESFSYDFRWYPISDSAVESTSCRLYMQGSTLNWADPVEGLFTPFSQQSVSMTSNIILDPDDEGVYTWFVSCASNHTGVCTEVNSSTYTMTFDYSGPVVSSDGPANNTITSSSVVTSFLATPADKFDSGNMNCELFLNNVSQGTTTVLNGTQASIDVSNFPTGSYDWYMNCSDNSGNSGISARNTIIFDNTPPTITLHEPISAVTFSQSPVVSFNFTPVDTYDSGNFTCELIVNNTIVNTSLVLNGTVKSLDHTFIEDGNYTWFVNCTDNFSNEGSSETRTLTIAVGPEPPIFDSLSLVTNESSLPIVGFIDGPGDVIVFATDGQGGSNTNTTQTYLTTFSESIENTTVGAVYLNNMSFGVNETLTYLNSNYYLGFANHYRANYYFYNITNVTTIGIDHYRVNLSSMIEDTIVVGENVYLYNSSRPAGWFNISVDLLLGENIIKVYGQRAGILGLPSTDTIYYDGMPPTINISGIGGLTNMSPISFIVTDDYVLNTSTALVNMTIGNTTYIFVQDDYPYTTSNWLLGENLTCIPLSGTQTNCTFYPRIDSENTLSDGNYNITFFIEDSFAHLGVASLLNNYTLLTNMSAVQSISDSGVTTSYQEIYINWTAINNPYLAYYELSVGTSVGATDFMDWFVVNKTRTNYTIVNSSFAFGQFYYVNIRAVDEVNNTGAVTSTDGIVIEDNTPPQYGFIKIVTPADSGWINKDYELDVYWNFTDNETGVAGYEYAIGTAPYPYAGWNSVKGVNATSSYNFTVTGLSLENNITYYVSVRAKNNYVYANSWSNWYSSNASVKVDTQLPYGGYISYEGGAIVVDYTNLTYKVGTDNLSGIVRASLAMKSSPLVNNLCGGFSSNWVEIRNLTLANQNDSLSITQFLENGNCYRFALFVYDLAGNVAVYNVSQLPTLTVDTTPPSQPVITDQGFLTGSTNLVFSWTQAVDSESGVSYYSYALGTSPGDNSVINWTSNANYLSVNLENLSLVDETTYYLTVHAYNAHNASLYSTAYSDGILYLDLVAPSPLTPIQIGLDTNASDGWLDNSSANFTNIILEGESNLASCVWSYYDISYVDSSAGYSHNCSEDPFNLGDYYCNITGLVDGVHTVYVACKDDAGNIQTFDTNTGLTFTKDFTAPIINITAPVDRQIISADLFLATVNITDASDVVARYTLRNYYSYTLLDEGNLTAPYLHVLNLSSYDGKLNYSITATDPYNRTSSSEVSFLINNDQPYVDVSLNGHYTQGDLWVKENATIDLLAVFYKNFTYSIVNSSGEVVSGYNLSTTNTTLQENITSYPISLDIANFTDGNYTLIIEAIANQTARFVENRTLVIDTITPTFILASLETKPTGLVYENYSSLSFYLVWQELNPLTVDFVYNYEGHTINITDAEIVDFGDQIYPNAVRYKVTLDPGLFTTNTSFTYFWRGTDFAGNINISAANIFNITNRAPVLVPANLSDGLALQSYTRLINFSDKDTSQNNVSFFACAVNNTNFVASAASHTSCQLTWSNPTPGNYTLLVTVADKLQGVNLSYDSLEYNVTILPSTLHTVHFNSLFPTIVNYLLNNTLEYSFLTSAAQVGLRVQTSSEYTTKFSSNALTVSAINVSPFSPANFYFRKLNPNYIYYDGDSLRSNSTYVPLDAYAANLSINSSSSIYYITFNYSSLGIIDPTNLVIFKYAFNQVTETINYTAGPGLLGGVIDTVAKTITIPVTSFSAFILANDTHPPVLETCFDGIQNQDETGIDCGGVCNACSNTGGSGGSYHSHGLSGGLLIKPKTCDDGIQNQNEIGVDCGGVCGVCANAILPNYTTETCFDGIQNQDETGIDCGGTFCDACTFAPQQVPVTQPVTKPLTRPPKQTTAPVLETPQVVHSSFQYKQLFIYGLVGLLLLGALAFVVLSKRKSLFHPHHYMTPITHLDDDIVHVAGYIQEQEKSGYTPDIITSFLVKSGYSQRNVDLAMHALLNPSQVIAVTNYMEKYYKEGHATEDLHSWLLEKGVHEGVLRIGVYNFNQRHIGGEPIGQPSIGQPKGSTTNSSMNL